MNANLNLPIARSRRLLFAAAPCLILLIGGLACNRSNRRPAATTGTGAQPDVLVAGPDGTGKVGELVITEEAMQLAEIKIAPVDRRQVTEKLSVTGVIEAGGDRSAAVTPRVAGKIVSLTAVAGDAVLVGQTLGLIESHELGAAQASHREARARLGAAELNLERQRKLAKLGQFGSPQFEAARSRSLDAEREVNSAQRYLQDERGRLAEAESSLRALKALVGQSDSARDVADTRLKRAERLYKVELVSLQELEQARADLRKAESDVSVARANLEQGEARITNARSQVASADGAAELARKQSRIASESLAREERVFQGQFLTSKEIVDAETAVRQARLSLEAAVHAIRLLGGEPGGGAIVPVTAPLTGRILDRSASLGETVDTEHHLFSIVNIDLVLAQLSVSAADLPRIRVGQAVHIYADTDPGQVFAGRVSSVGAAASEGTRTVPVRVALENRKGALRPGAFVQAKVVTDIRRERITVPDEAVQEHPGEKMSVYVALPGTPGAFEVRHVKLGMRGEGWREVTSRLAPGERIAVSGTFYLKSEALKSALSDGCCSVPGGK